MLNKTKATFQEYPLKFWVLVIATFIDRVGGTLIFPFFALYITQRFNVGMTQAGVLFAIFSVTGFMGSMFLSTRNSLAFSPYLQEKSKPWRGSQGLSVF